MHGTRVFIAFDGIPYQKLVGANALDDTAQTTLASTQLCRYRRRMRGQRFPLYFSLWRVGLEGRWERNDRGKGKVRGGKPTDLCGGSPRVRGTAQCLRREPRLPRAVTRPDAEAQRQWTLPPLSPRAPVRALQERDKHAQQNERKCEIARHQPPMSSISFILH
jgi:hypothetical protein